MAEKLAKNSSLTSQALGGVLKEALPSHGVREGKRFETKTYFGIFGMRNRGKMKNKRLLEAHFSKLFSSQELLHAFYHDLSRRVQPRPSSSFIQLHVAAHMWLRRLQPIFSLCDVDDIDKEVSAKMGSSPPLPKLPRGIEAWNSQQLFRCVTFHAPMLMIHCVCLIEVNTWHMISHVIWFLCA